MVAGGFENDLGTSNGCKHQHPAHEYAGCQSVAEADCRICVVVMPRKIAGEARQRAHGQEIAKEGSHTNSA